MCIILDASAFLSGKFTSLPSNHQNCFTTDLVYEEISKGAPGRLIDNLISAGLVIRNPGDTTMVRNVADRTGDLDLLSDADISILALAIEIERCRVITDDFRIQNVLKSLDIEFIPAGEIGTRTIERTFIWTFRCRGCGRFFDEDPGIDCPICGSGIRKVRKMVSG
jgi:UPF0271 protein